MHTIIERVAEINKASFSEFNSFNQRYREFCNIVCGLPYHKDYIN